MTYTSTEQQAHQIKAAFFQAFGPSAERDWHVDVQPERQSLTDDQIDAAFQKAAQAAGHTFCDWGWRQFARAIQDAHGIKEDTP